MKPNRPYFRFPDTQPLDTSRPALSINDLEGFDPDAPAKSGERRFLCPHCGHEKARNAAHRSLSLNTETGAWNCHRCHAAGKLREYWEERPYRRRDRARQSLRRAFSLQDPLAAAAAEAKEEWRIRLCRLQPLAGTRGEAYLAGRGIPLESAHLAGARYHRCWYGRPAVVFPLRDREGRLTAAQGRFVDELGAEGLKTMDAGPKSSSVFATPGAWEAGTLILVEAPICALSLAVCGFPALATAGCSLPDWLAWACALRAVVIATDNDEAGQAAAAKWAPVLKARGAKVRRLRPAGAKDWNDVLCADPEALRRALVAKLGPPGSEDSSRGAVPSAPAASVPPAAAPPAENAGSLVLRAEQSAPRAVASPTAAPAPPSVDRPKDTLETVFENLTQWAARSR